MNVKTAHLFDQYGEILQVAEPLFRDYGDRLLFGGQIVCLRTHEDSSLLHTTLQRLGKGKVLVVDGGGSLRRALLDESLAQLARYNAWEGLLLFGALRDSEELRHIDLGIKALGTSPAASPRNGYGELNTPLHFAGVNFLPGHFLYADADGVLISPRNLLL